MPAKINLARPGLGEFLERIRPELVPLNQCFSYFLAGPPLNEEDLREYLADPVAAVPPSLSAALPNVALLLVPYLESAGGKGGAEPHVSFEAPPDARTLASAGARHKGGALLAISVQNQEMADYHYHLYHELAHLAADVLSDEQWSQYYGLIREELGSNVNGEVDDSSWQLKQVLRRRQTNVRKETKAFLEYARESFIDTMTLYLHGLCCDIDVETGPRQLPSRFLRRRLRLLAQMFPPPHGYALFPEDLDSAAPAGGAAVP